MLKVAFKYLILFCGLSVLILVIYRNILVSRIPVEQKNIPFFASQEEIPLPRRPGTQSLKIVGPPLKILKFQLDFKQNPLALDWDYLESIDKSADVLVEGSIDASGNFFINRIKDRGHPEAGRYIKKILDSWKFVQYKVGPIQYYFNVPSRMENMKVQIDLRQLRKNPKHLSPGDLLKDGMVYYIEGLERDNVMIVN